MTNTDNFKRRQCGLSLLELAVVLVIIGLIVGGVVVGKELIYQSKLRATLSQLDKFQSATGAFYAKYGCLPGDCPNASSLGLGANGNGDGIIGGYCEIFPNGLCPAGETENQFLGYVPRNGYSGIPNESVTYWSELQTAGFIEFADPLVTFYPQPQTPLKHGSWWMLQAESSMGPTVVNNFAIAEEYGLYATAQAICNECNCPSMSPADTFYFDQKIDDGLPFSGNVQANKAFGYPLEWWQTGTALVSQGSPGTTSPVCVDNTTTPPQYNMQNTTINLCLPVFSAKF